MDNPNLEVQLAKAVFENPAMAGRYLSIISESLAAYEKAVKHRRQHEAYLAISGILDPKSARLRLIPFSIDAMVYLFPNGNTANHSPLERQCFDIFKQAAIEFFKKADNFTWLETHRGPDYADWVRNNIVE